ncbi:MAG: endonuclease/exonuclease/phosphatase family protein [Chloroflexota bacterium]
MMMKQHRFVLFCLPLALAALLLLTWGGLMPAGGVQAANSSDTLQALASHPFINEIHYDNDGTDVNEGVEIAGPAGLDLSGWSLVAYNGNGGASYSTISLSGSLPDLQNGYGTIFFPVGGLQNGAPDGIALVAPGDVVSQFLCYEGTFVATDGPANGMTCVDIGVAEASSQPVGFSLQLVGTGSAYDDFIWAGPLASTYNNVNAGQTFLVALRLSKSAPPSVYVGDIFTYTLVVTNSTGVTVNQVTLTDTLPLNATFHAASDEGVLVGGVVSWTIPGDFLADAVLTRTFSVTAPVAGPIVNADYAVSASDWVTPAVGGPVTTTANLITTVDLAVSKSGPDFGMTGGTLDYFIELTTQGLISATHVVLTDTLPAGLAYVTDTSGIVPVTGTGSLVWALPDIAPDSTWGFTLTVAVSDTLPSATLLTNQATVSTDANGDQPQNNTASCETTIYPLVSIYDIQYVPDPAVSDSSVYSGTRVWVEGVVTAEPGEIDDQDVAFVMQQPGGGAWHGLLVYKGSRFETLEAPEGTRLRVLGLVKEYYGMTEMDLALGHAAIEELGWQTPLTPTVIGTGQLSDVDRAVSEPWEGVLLEFRDAVVTDDALGYGEWYFDDGSGPVRADDLGEKDGDLTYAPADGDLLTFVRGIPWYSFGNYKLEPRYDADIALHVAVPVLTKSAPALIGPGETFTYTLSLENKTGFTLNSVVISDVVPQNSSLASALDGGVLDGDTLAWHVASLADQTTVQVRFVVTATDQLGAAIWNNHYAVTAANYVTPTFGAPVVTVVGDYTPIPIIQGTGQASPLDGQAVNTRGVVVGLFEGNTSSNSRFNGFYLQDPTGDGDAATSDGIFVHHGTGSVSVDIGDLVVVTGTVQEFDEYDGAGCEGDCLTQVRISANATGYRVLGSGVVTPTVIDPLGDPAASMAYFESLEGMLIELPMTATVVGPTSYGAVTVIPGDEPVKRVLRHSPQEGMPFNVRHWLRYGGNAPQLSVGSAIAPFEGPLTWSFGWYMAVTQPGAFWTPVYTQTLPSETPSWPAPDARQFSVATFNTYNFDELGSKLDKVVLTVQQLNGPTVLALEEISPTAVLPDLIGDLAALGYHYNYAYSLPDVGGHGVAILWNSDVITQAAWSTAYQSCSPYGSSSSTYDPLWDTCVARGEYPLFSRRPVVLTATLTLTDTSRQVVFIANHFKAKSDGLPGDMRRLGQAAFVNQLVTDFIAAGSENVVVMGDLNDFEDSEALENLYHGGALTNTWYTLPSEARYSYIYHGISQVLDHILISPAMLDWLVDFGPLHLNADYPYDLYNDNGNVPWRTSDHDPLAATFDIPRDVPPPPTTYRVYLPLVIR